MTDEESALLQVLKQRYGELQIEQAAIDARMSEVRDMIAQLSAPRRRGRKIPQRETVEPLHVDDVVVEEITEDAA